MLCDEGEYQDEVGMLTCKTCPAGHFCLQSTTTPEVCPAGSYCPAGTRYANEFLCPNGTYSNVTGLTRVENCTACTPGYYCGSRGLTEPTGKCLAGYFCGGGSSVASPFDSSTTTHQVSYIGETCVTVLNTTLNDICPPGHYCPEGSASPIQCPPGTNSSSTGLVDVGDCPPCTRGYYCPLNGTVYATRLCLAGYYCPDGTADITTAITCPAGSYCPLGSVDPIPCAAGTSPYSTLPAMASGVDPEASTRSHNIRPRPA